MSKNNSNIKKIYTEEDIHLAFVAGLNRGIYVASIIMRTPIEGDYPSYEEYILQVNGKNRL